MSTGTLAVSGADVVSPAAEKVPTATAVLSIAAQEGATDPNAVKSAIEETLKPLRPRTLVVFNMLIFFSFWEYSSAPLGRAKADNNLCFIS
jgi:hypothetical protein